MYESDQIVRYLYHHYGSGCVPLFHRLGPLNTALSFVATALRPTRGRRVIALPRHRPVALPVLYNLESSPQCRKVREVLTELDLPYLCKNAPPGSGAYDELPEVGGRRRVPVFIDPNTGSTLADGDAIVDYLYRTYAAG
jgi:glutathione S-transferase